VPAPGQRPTLHQNSRPRRTSLPVSEPDSPISNNISRAAFAGVGEWWPGLRAWLIAGLGVALAVGLGFALHRLLLEVRYDSVMKAVNATPGAAILAALAATAISYFALTEYDASSLRYAGAKVARGTVLLTSFVAYSLSNTIGLGPLSGAAVRMRLYSAAGLEPPQIARVIAFNAAAFGLGMLAFGAVGLLWGASEVAQLLHTQAWALRSLAIAMIAFVAGLLWICTKRRVLRLEFVLGRRWSWSLRMPPLRLALRQLVISAFELGASASALWFLLPANHIAPSTFASTMPGNQRGNAAASPRMAQRSDAGRAIRTCRRTVAIARGV